MLTRLHRVRRSIAAGSRIAFGPLLIAGLLSTLTLPAATSIEVMTTADAFVCTGSANNPIVISTDAFPNATDEHDLSSSNFGGAGTLAISSASSVKGEFQSVIRFELAAAIESFNTTYGIGGWTLTSVQLKLMTNYGTAGVQPNNAIFNVIHSGLFGITWLADDSWEEGSTDANPSAPGTYGITFDDIGSLTATGSESLGTYRYDPPGDNVPFYYSLPLSSDNLVTDLMAGENLSLLFSAADDEINFLFNSRRKLGNEPYLVLTADAVPEPATDALLLVSATLFLLKWQRYRRHS